MLMCKDSGGQLAASAVLKAMEMNIMPAPLYLMLICPVVDSTAGISSAWAESQYSPWLTPTRMQWYREKYFGSSGSETDWLASPNHAPEDLLARLPPAFIAVAECDLLAPEEIAFADQLKAQAVAVDMRVYKGATHSVLVLAGYRHPHQIVLRGSGRLTTSF